MKTIFLDPATWDLALDSGANIAVASDPYSQWQDVSSAARLFRGELYYDGTSGIPYFEQILGKAPPLALVKAYLVAAALTVPGVVSAKCFISSFVGRKLSGQIQTVNDAGQTGASSF